MEQHVKENEVLKDILDTERLTKFADATEKLAIIDAFIQFSDNPTSATAGYGIEQNYPPISQNLSKRYSLGRTQVETIVAFVRDCFEKVRQVNHDVYFWREAIKDYIRENYSDELLHWFDLLYNSLNEVEKSQFLFLIYGLPKSGSPYEIHKWFMCFFDKEERTAETELKDLMVQLGLGNLLYYKTSRGYEETRFIPTPFLNQLGRRFKKAVPIKDDQIKIFFENLTLDNVKLLEKCLKETVPVLDCRVGRVTQTAMHILEASKSYFGVSPFSINTLGELTKLRKLDLTKDWKAKFDDVFNSFVKEIYPFAELRHMFNLEGAYCWEIKYADNPEIEPINVVILLSPYVFPVLSHSTILDKMKRITSSLSLIFLIEETLPTIAESFRYVSGKNLIFLFNDRKKSFYVIEKSASLSEDKIFTINSFLSRFLPALEKEVKISETWPKDTGDYIENLKYFNQFPKLITIRNRIAIMEPRLRNAIRAKFLEKFGDQWQEKVREKLPQKVKKLENVMKRRSDKGETKDFLDGTTLGELTEILRTFLEVLNIDKNATSFLTIILQHRNILEHPLKNIESDIDEKKYRTIKLALDYIDGVICPE